MAAARRALSPRKRPVQARARRTVDALLEAAAQVFEREGYAGATTDRVAARAGVSVGSLYQYFPNKDALLVALAERHLDEAEARVGAVLAELDGAGAVPVARAVPALLDAMVALHATRPRLHRVLTEETPLPPRVRRRVEALEAAAAEAVAALLARAPDARVRDARIAAHLVVAVGDALAHRLLIRPPAGADAAPLRREAETLVLAYLAGAPPRS